MEVFNMANMNKGITLTIDSKELDRLAIGARLYDMFLMNTDTINFSSIIKLDSESGELRIKEQDLLKIIEMVNLYQFNPHIVLCR